LFVTGVVEWELLLRWSGQDWIGPRETMIDQLYAVAFLLTYISFERARLPFAKQIEYLGARSYGIYLTHSPVLEYTARITYHVLPAIFAYQIIFQRSYIWWASVYPCCVYHLAAYAAEGLEPLHQALQLHQQPDRQRQPDQRGGQHDVRCFVFTSSIAVYGAARAADDRGDRPHPEDPYGIAKLAVEQELKVCKEMLAWTTSSSARTTSTASARTSATSTATWSASS
jgi:hypothetical protein